MTFRWPASHFMWLFVCALFATYGTASRGEESLRPAPAKLVVEVKVVEVNIDKLKGLGFDWTRLTPTGIEHTAVDRLPKIDGRPITVEELNGFLEALRQNNLARVLAEPTLVTLDGRPASISIGDTQLDIVPIVLGTGRVRLDCRIAISAPKSEPGRHANKRDTSPTAYPFRLDLATELEPGKTCLVGHARTDKSTHGNSPETETLVLVRVEKAESLR
jgi:Flp pilus assembly secretin CpaC